VPVKPSRKIAFTGGDLFPKGRPEQVAIAERELGKPLTSAPAA
jgi:hypothetical protein